MDSARRKPPRVSAAPVPLSARPVLPRSPLQPPPPVRGGQKTPRNGARSSVFLRVGLLVVFLFLGSLGYVAAKIITTSRSITLESPARDFITDIAGMALHLGGNRTPLDGEDEGRINILLLGRAGETYPGKNLTDTIMIVSLHLGERRTALLSLPRDLFVPIGNTSSSAKLNSLYQIGLNDNGNGVSLVAQTVTRITGLPIHYSLVLDFDGFERFIDTVGGIHIDVPHDLYDPRYPGKNYSYETFQIKKGWQKLDGVTALKYVRERHADPEGDFGRAKRQQQVLQAVRDRVLSAGTFLNPLRISAILDVLGESLRTDLTLDEIVSFAELSRSFDTRNVTTVVVDAWKKNSLLRVAHLPVTQGLAFILVPRSGRFDELQTLALNIFDRERLARERDQIAKESPVFIIRSTVAHKAYANELSALVQDELGMKRVTIERPYLDNAPEKSTIAGDPRIVPFSLQALRSRFGFSIDALGSAASPDEHSQHIVILTLGHDIETSRLLDDTGSLSEAGADYPPSL